MIKVGAVIVTYNPDVIQLQKNVSSISPQVDTVIIVDNGSKNVTEIRKLSANYDNLYLQELGINQGIAKAQNQGLATLKEGKHDWAVTLDQDTVLPNRYVSRLLDASEDLDNVGIITGAYIDTKWDTAKISSVRQSRTPEIQQFNQEIASGNIVSIVAWEKVGGMDEQLFIDYVDFDFDYKLIENGYHLYRVNNVEFEHEIGSPIKKNWLTKVLLLDHKELFDHSNQRMYYINRNRLIVRKRYPQFGSPLGMLIAEVLNLREICVMDSPRFRKLYKAVKGILEGIFYRVRG